MRGDIADGHAAGVEPEHPVVQAGQPGLALAAPAAAQSCRRGHAGCGSRPARDRSAASWRVDAVAHVRARRARRPADARDARSAPRPAPVSITRPASWVSSPPGPVISSGSRPFSASSSASAGNSPASRSTAACVGTLSVSWCAEMNHSSDQRWSCWSSVAFPARRAASVIPDHTQFIGQTPELRARFDAFGAAQHPLTTSTWRRCFSMRSFSRSALRGPRRACWSPGASPIRASGCSCQ